MLHKCLQLRIWPSRCPVGFKGPVAWVFMAPWSRNSRRSVLPRLVPLRSAILTPRVPLCPAALQIYWLAANLSSIPNCRRQSAEWTKQKESERRAVILLYHHISHRIQMIYLTAGRESRRSPSHRLCIVLRFITPTALRVKSRTVTTGWLQESKITAAEKWADWGMNADDVLWLKTCPSNQMTQQRFSPLTVWGVSSW